MKALLKKKDAYFWLAGALLLIGCAVRLVALSSLPCGLNQDEAYAGYNAWCLLHYGVDSAGYHNPVYMVAWGSGMNVLETYLMMPFVALLGPCTLAFRLPQALEPACRCCASTALANARAAVASRSAPLPCWRQARGM